MKKSLALIVILFLELLILIFLLLGGEFNRKFISDISVGLIANFIVLLIAVFVIDGLFQKERWSKVRQINELLSNQVYLTTNRTIFILLEHLGLVTEQDKTDPMFESVINKVGSYNLSKEFYNKIQKETEREYFIDCFIGKLSNGVVNISRDLRNLSFSVDPKIEELLNEIEKLNIEIKDKQTKILTSEKINTEYVDSIIKLIPLGTLEKIFNNLIEISQKAKANQLFLFLD